MTVHAHIAAWEENVGHLEMKVYNFYMIIHSADLIRGEEVAVVVKP